MDSEIAYAVLHVLIRSGDILPDVDDCLNDDIDCYNCEDLVRHIADRFKRKYKIVYDESGKWFRERVDVDEQQALYFADVIVNKLFRNLVLQNELRGEFAAMKAMNHMYKYDAKSFFQDVDVVRLSRALEILFPEPYQEAVKHITDFCQDELLALMAPGAGALGCV